MHLVSKVFLIVILINAYFSVIFCPALSLCTKTLSRDKCFAVVLIIKLSSPDKKNIYTTVRRTRKITKTMLGAPSWIWPKLYEGAAEVNSANEVGWAGSKNQEGRSKDRLNSGVDQIVSIHSFSHIV